MGARRLAVLLFVIASAGCRNGGPAAPALSEVRPLIGTGGLGWGAGSMLPGPAHPFGLAKPGPDTSLNGAAPDFEHCAGYWYEDTDVRGFSQIHLSGTGLPDYGVVMVMPVLGLPQGAIDESFYSQRLDHKLETAEVGYYRLVLSPSAIEVEITATPRTSIYRMSYPKGKEANLVVSLAHSLNGDIKDAQIAVDESARTISGWIQQQGKIAKNGGFRLYFVMRVEQPFTKSDTALQGGTGALLSFGAGLTAPLRFQIGLSFVDLDTAKANLDAEWAAYDFDRARAAAGRAWAPILGIAEVEGGSPAHRAAFYTALYHAHMMPTLFTEAGQKYRGLDGQVHTADGFVYFSDFSLWDTFRTLHPLMTLLEPERELDFVKTLLAMTEQSGRIPKWPLATGESDVMIEYHGETVIADSYLKGVRDFDVEKAYGWIRAAAMDPRRADTQKSLRQRDCILAYLDHGYCPSDVEGGSASKTLEDSFDDFVDAELAAALGHMDDAALLLGRASSWRHLANETGLVQGRHADGSFPAGFQEDLFGGDFVEGNARQWATFVPHDTAGLAEVRGGRDQAVAFLDGLFQGSAATPLTPLPELYFWAGNEQDIHAPYLFAELGRPDLTDKWVDWVINNRYGATPAGLPGNDDGGTMSAWYVFSALGFYPKVGESRYVLGKPLFPKVVLHLGQKTLVIRADGLSDRAIYVKRVLFNGKALAEPFIAHGDLAQGGELVFEMTDAP